MTDTKKDTGKTGKEKEPEKTTEIAKKETTFSERFSHMVIREYTGNIGETNLTAFQKRLIQNYFIATDMALKAAEDKRMKKSENYRDVIAVAWPNVNMEGLALNVVACAKIGYDPALPNHISMVPYKNNKTQKYDIGFIEGYRGRELKAKKYGYEVPDHVIVELVYSKDRFVPIKKDKDNKVETYSFRISENPFDRGDIVGGFYYHMYDEMPEKSKLMFYPLSEIEKRKPQYASVEFWGGEKTVYGEDGKKTKEKEKVDGYFAEMCWKTIYHMAYRAITIDSEKIDDNLMRILENEKTLEANREPQNLEALREINVEQKGNKKNLNVHDIECEEVNKDTPKVEEKESENSGNLANLGKEKDKVTDGPDYN